MISLLGENLKRIRTEKNITATELSQLSHVGLSTISQIETGVRQSLRSQTIEKLATALGITANDLFNINEGEYTVSDLSESIQIILSDDDISINGKKMSPTEKENFRFGIDILINTIIANRK
ncbi:helix-turn-helix domain-containing protein [Clostridium botulinum]|uniref:helix-turn-helix domain-containing protein n=1 Tax=Clostridium botulinum TaxID=1491 RepID=UPI00077368CA|nr:helix-turn-helix transcriptional regulator [Clostridium botulinum]